MVFAIIKTLSRSVPAPYFGISDDAERSQGLHHDNDRNDCQDPPPGDPRAGARPDSGAGGGSG